MPLDHQLVVLARVEIRVLVDPIHDVDETLEEDAGGDADLASELARDAPGQLLDHLIGHAPLDEIICSLGTAQRGSLRLPL